MKYLTYSFLSIIPLSLFTNLQIPTDVPKPNNNSPVDFSKPENVVLYIGIPLLCIVLFFIWKRNRRKK